MTDYILQAMTHIIVGRRLARFPVDKGSIAQVLSANSFRAAEIVEYLDEAMALAGVTDPNPVDPMLAAVRAMQEGNRLYNVGCHDDMDNDACDALAERTYDPPMQALVAGVETRSIIGAAAAIQLANNEGSGALVDAVLESVARYFEPLLALVLADSDADRVDAIQQKRDVQHDRKVGEYLENLS